MKHILCYSNRIEVAYLEAIALRRQEELIREEEAAEQAEIELKARREIAEREKRIKKKQVGTCQANFVIHGIVIEMAILSSNSLI